MTRKSTLLTIFCCIAAITAMAQYNLPQSRIWAMGNKVGVDFTNLASPAPIVTSLANTNEAAASICDTAGALLFYSNGGVVWNKNGVAMPHGGNLTGTTGNTLSTTQGAVIVPVPDSAGKYYLFSLTSVSNCKLYCNKIDMSLNGGLGDVDTTFSLRGQSLADSFLTEKMTAVPGCDNSVWLMTHHQNSSVFRAYHITAAGINLTPVLSAVSSFAGANYLQGVMKFSPDRTKLLNCNFRAASPQNAGVEVFSFDYNTGILSNGIVLDNTSFYGGTFSPNSSKVYAGSTVNSSIYQWDLTAATPSATKTLLGASGQYTDLKLGPDGKIYFGAAPGGAGYSNYRYMGRVNAPDSVGAACVFQDSVTALIFPAATGSYGALAQGMPNDVAVPIPAVNQYVRSLDTSICQMLQAYTFTAPAGYTNMQWDNGDTTLTRTVTARGTYWVKCISACNTRVDTFTIRGADMPALSVTATANVLTATTGFAAYQWYKDGVLINGATANIYTATASGIYKVHADFGGGCSDTASQAVTIATGIPQYNANGNTVAIYPNPATTVVTIDYPELVNVSVRSVDGKEVLAVKETHQINVSQLAEGLYMLVITDKQQQRLAMQKLIKK